MSLETCILEAKLEERRKGETARACERARERENEERGRIVGLREKEREVVLASRPPCC